VGVFAIRRFFAQKTHFDKLSIGELTVDHLVIKNSTSLPPPKQ